MLFSGTRITLTACVAKIDFAMGYNCEWQGEIQFALWSRETVNLFTAALYVKDAPCKSFIIVFNSIEKYNV